jgi:CheY-like chemotaxis protein
MTAVSALERGRAAFQQQAWVDAYAQLQRAYEEKLLAVEDVERLAIGAIQVGQDDDAVAALAYAHQERLRVGDPPRAARCAFWLGMNLLNRGELARLAEGGRDALEIAAETRPAVVLLDLRMPELDGWEVARGLKALLVNPKIVVMSAGSDKLEDIAREMGAAGYLAKPFDIDQLLAIVKRLASC